jgi:hypothetical protein
MKKRMNKDERQAIINLVVAKANEVIKNEVESKLIKEKSYLEWKKLNEEIKKLDDRKQELYKKNNEIQNNLNKKYNCYFNLDFKGKLNINENGNYSAVIIKRLEIENKLVLMGIEGIDVNAMIDQLVAEYNK